ncbi:ABC transporter ATP-binding protein [Propioniciclava soli]|uniref:ABC transporter ATP-binding protein n=1 Tax=Propioniciclava soli TaxID=2775081 RepID=UPI001E3CA0E7|nr:ABC transporter ATP-binding protein [Propioniciclava soli]
MLHVNAVSKTFLGGQPVHALREVSLQVAAGETVALVGPSGSGKTTLLRLIACHLTPDSGDLTVDGQRVPRPSTAAGAAFRRRMVGVLLQDLGLIEMDTALANVMLPLRLAGVGRRDAARRAHLQLQKRGLDHRSDAPVNTLSGGQRQRVALARALVCEPPLVLADEPTSNLDADQASQAVSDLLAQAREHRAVLIATHDPEVWTRCDRVLHLDDGRITPHG